MSTVGHEFASILFPDGRETRDGEAPPFFRDLNFDAIVEAVASRRKGYPIEPFFSVPLRTVDEIAYRHEVFRELENEALRSALVDFSEQELRVRRYLELASKQEFELAKQHTFHDAAVRYTSAIVALAGALDESGLHSRALSGLRDFLAGYTASPEFARLAGDARDVLEGLGRVSYAVRIKGNRVTVDRFEDQPDYTAEIEEAFARFRHEPVDDHLAIPPDTGTMDLVEAEIARRVAKLYPEEFAALDAFCDLHHDFVHPVVARFEQEVQFYLAWHEQVEALRRLGLDCCLPEVSSDSKETEAERTFDLALALKSKEGARAIVPNDFELHGTERILVVSGPNQGGKTTFARAFGQLHQLARLGVPVPARRARLFLADEIYTHFEREEDVANLRGKLDDELVRVKRILEEASSDSVAILNEIFSATTLADAVVLGTEVLSRLIELDCLGVCVTFVDELAALSEATVSMVATVEPEDPAIRTFRIVRRPADGRAYASALAEKYGLSYERLKERPVS